MRLSLEVVSRHRFVLSWVQSFFFSDFVHDYKINEFCNIFLNLLRQSWPVEVSRKFWFFLFYFYFFRKLPTACVRSWNQLMPILYLSFEFLFCTWLLHRLTLGVFDFLSYVFFKAVWASGSRMPLGMFQVCYYLIMR